MRQQRLSQLEAGLSTTAGQELLASASKGGSQQAGTKPRVDSKRESALQMFHCWTDCEPNAASGTPSQQPFEVVSSSRVGVANASQEQSGCEARLRA
jgi:hypothetical protein